ncbi:alpha/beta hydrolase [Paenibacillus sp. 1-18]|uniref:alpha/beta hydrolase n=1 Tax=Paenibacillus sp. 1-18 TaxID=1333846 RepID=UPI0004B56217
MYEEENNISSLYSYDIHLSSQLDPNRTYPTIFTLHGKGSNEQDIYGVVEPLSEELIIIGIRGDLPMGGGFQYYELKSLGNPLCGQFDRAIEQLQAFVHYATDKYPVDPGKRYFLGFRQGAILSCRLHLRWETN